MGVDLKVSYPEGNQIDYQREKLNIIVSFQSTKPVSFTTKLEFLDEAAKKYTVVVSGTVDNSILTMNVE